MTIRIVNTFHTKIAMLTNPKKKIGICIGLKALHKDVYMCIFLLQNVYIRRILCLKVKKSSIIKRKINII